MKRKKIIRQIIGFGLFFLLVILGLFSWSRGLFNFIGRPIWKLEKTVNETFYNNNYIFRTKSSITKENHNLIEENYNLKLSMVDYQILKKENEELKEILGRISSTNDFILGNILTKPNYSPYDTMIIDVGIDVGLERGNYVYANGNIPIGIVDSVYDKTSLISLFSNPGQKTEGFLEVGNVSVELIGRGGGNFEMIIPVELSAERGTAIYLPGDSSQVIAIINEVISKPSDPFKRIISSSPVNIQNLKWVEVKK